MMEYMRTIMTNFMTIDVSELQKKLSKFFLEQEANTGALETYADVAVEEVD